MITREEALRRLEKVANDIEALRDALADGWVEMDDNEATSAFLAKCGDWEDTRSPEEIIADIYASRTISNRNADLFSQTD